VAFGDNETFNVLDVKATLDIKRYARIDVDAAAAEFLYSDRALLAPEKNTDFLKRCVETFRWVNFADQATGRVYLRIERGAPIMKDSAAFEMAVLNPDTLAAIRAVAPEATRGVPEARQAEHLCAKNGTSRFPTLGKWGRSA
jgi:hypothetical protein